MMEADTGRSIGLPRILIFLLIAWALALEEVALGDVLITEVMSSNATALVDENGDASDWVELTYTGPGLSVNLDGWHLTDNAADLTKWRFPAVEIVRFGYLVVFCSGDDRRDPDEELHANFGLNDQGDYLALVGPDGTVAMSFSPTLPPLIQDASHGLAVDPVESKVIEVGDLGRVWIPKNDSLGSSWTTRSFDDSGWLEGPSGFGFDVKFPPTYSEIIGTDVSEAMHRESPSAYIRIPFEITSPADIDLLRIRLQYGDGIVAYVNGQQILAAGVPDNPTWSSVSQGVRFPNDVLEFEEFDILTQNFPGLLIQGTNVLAIHGLNNHVNNNDFVVVPELIALDWRDVDVNSRRYFYPSTPSQHNGTGFDDISSPPTASVESGVYPSQVSVELLRTGGAGDIRFTRDGTLPTLDDELYDAPLVLTETTELMARTFEPSNTPSAILSAHYTILASELDDFDSDLPVVVIDTFDEVPDRAALSRGQIHVLDRSPDGRTRLANVPDISGRIGIKIRGATSSTWPKKSFNVEFRDPHDRDLNVRFLDFSRESDWILFGSHFIDQTRLHNPVVYGLSNRMGRRAPETQPVELFLSQNGDGVVDESDYYGVVHLMEKIKRDDDRVDIADLERSDTTEPEISGGYMLKIDDRDSDETSIDGSLLVIDPPASELTDVQRDWISDYVDDFEAALASPSPSDPQTGYPAFIDEDSFVDLHIIDQLSKNIDTNIRSGYMYKDRGGKLFRGPTWDHDRAFGASGEEPDTFSNTADVRARSGWWSVLMNSDRFLQTYETRWSAFRQGPLDIEELLREIDYQASLIEEAHARDYEKWRLVPDARVRSPSGWRNSVESFKDFARERILFMDGAYLFVPVLTPEGGNVSAPLDVTMAVSTGSGQVYYTINGPDPLTEDEMIAPEAQLYTDAVTMSANTRIRARALDNGHWSAMVEEVYVVSPPTLAITELMYNPPTSQLFEFLEVCNFGETPQTIAGASIDGVDFVFRSGPLTTLEAGECAVVVNDYDIFSSVYDLTDIRVAGVYSGNLRNEGEEITLLGPLTEPIARFRYSPYWYPETNRGGHSLELIAPWSSPDTWSEPEAWRASTEAGGSPGVGLPPDADFRRGDVVPDGALGLDDVFNALVYQFLGTHSPSCLAALDFNDDGAIGIDDALASLFFQFQGATPPPDPGMTNCGPDPTKAALSCREYPTDQCD